MLSLLIKRMINPSAERNKDPILHILKKILKNDKQRNLLEIASGTGQHVAHFGSHFPNILFQPTEFDSSMLISIKSHIDECPTKNICDPMIVNVRLSYREWGKNKSNNGPYIFGHSHRAFSDYVECFDYMLNINMIHISNIDCTAGLFSNASELLKKDGLLITYGPYAENGIISPESNVHFHESLIRTDKSWGVRDIGDLKIMAGEEGMEFVKWYDMPANNKLAIWKRID